MDKQGECDERSISVSTSSYPNSLHRCFQPGLGSLSRGKLGLRVVVPSTTEGTHQPVGDESSSFGLVSFQNYSPSQICGSGNRLYYRSSLSEKPGRHSLFQPVCSLQGDSPSLLGTSDSTGSEAYSGSSQCTSRHTVSLSSTSEHRMGITTNNVQCISLLWGRPHLDLFATSLNHKLDTFASSVPGCFIVFSIAKQNNNKTRTD